MYFFFSSRLSIPQETFESSVVRVSYSAHSCEPDSTREMPLKVVRMSSSIMMMYGTWYMRGIATWTTYLRKAVIFEFFFLEWLAIS